jgi:nucleoid DNA-binding protein
MAAKKRRAKTTKTKAKTTKRKGVKRTAKKTSAKKKAPKAKAVSAGPLGRVSKIYTKSTLLSTLSDRTGVPKREVGLVLSELTTVVEGHLKKGGPGKFTLPGMLKMVVKNSPARKARKGINPFTGEPTTFKAKPASKKVKVTALKALKEMVN